MTDFVKRLKLEDFSTEILKNCHEDLITSLQIELLDLQHKIEKSYQNFRISAKRQELRSKCTQPKKHALNVSDMIAHSATQLTTSDTSNVNDPIACYGQVDSIGSFGNDRTRSTLPDLSTLKETQLLRSVKPNSCLPSPGKPEKLDGKSAFDLGEPFIPRILGPIVKPVDVIFANEKALPFNYDVQLHSNSVNSVNARAVSPGLSVFTNSMSNSLSSLTNDSSLNVGYMRGCNSSDTSRCADSSNSEHSSAACASYTNPSVCSSTIHSKQSPTSSQSKKFTERLIWEVKLTALQFQSPELNFNSNPFDWGEMKWIMSFGCKDNIDSTPSNPSLITTASQSVFVQPKLYYFYLKAVNGDAKFDFRLKLRLSVHQKEPNYPILFSKCVVENSFVDYPKPTFGFGDFISLPMLQRMISPSSNSIVLGMNASITIL